MILNCDIIRDHCRKNCCVKCLKDVNRFCCNSNIYLALSAPNEIHGELLKHYSIDLSVVEL